MKLTSKLSGKQFIFSQLVILMMSLIFLAGLYYLLNIQYQQGGKMNSLKWGPVTTAPKSLRIDLEQPDNDTLTYSSSIIISGKTAPHVEVLITTDSRDLVIKSKADGSFSTILKLDEGVNKITAVVFDVTGDWRSAERVVYYSEEKL